ncbi:transposase [Paenibacillus alba]
MAKQMLLMLRESKASRLWVTMNRWYLCKEFLAFLEEHQFDWVTKAKRNTSLFCKITQIEAEVALEDENPVTYKGAYLLSSNRFNASEEALRTYVKRWRIEVFLRTAKQELAFEKCHSNRRRITMLILSSCLQQKRYSLWHFTN